MHETTGGVRQRVLIRLGLLDLRRQGGIDRYVPLGRELDKALRQIEVARRQRTADFTLGDIAIKGCGERLVGDGGWIVRRRQALMRGEAAGQEKACGNREQDA